MDFPYGFGTVATYSCNIDGALSGGNTVRTCGGDGTNTVGVWSGTASTCQGENIFPPLVQYLHNSKTD